MAQKDIIDQYDYDVIYDTETTGLPDWKVPSESETQPHLASIAALKCERKTGKIIQSLDLIIRPNGWEISKEMTDIHGISHDFASKVGVPELDAVSIFKNLCRDSMRVSFNQTFDQRMIRIQFKRRGLVDDAEQWKRLDNHACAMIMSKWIMKLKPYGKYGPRNPKLAAAYKYFTGKELIGAHGAMADTLAAKEVFYAIVAANGGKIFVPDGTNGKGPMVEPFVNDEDGDDSEALFSSGIDEIGEDHIRASTEEEKEYFEDLDEDSPVDQDFDY